MNNIIDVEAEQTLSDAFLLYAGYNIQRRAIPDARDGLKWGTRQLIYSQALGKLTHDKPYKKAIKSVSQAMGFCYTHGDASAYGTFIRMAKPFAYRYPLQEAVGNYGTLMDPEDHSASRYVDLRGSEIASKLLFNINKDCIDEWEETYDLEGKFPRVLPSVGFWGGINGCIAIGSGMSSSLPPLNLREVNDVLIKLLYNPNIPDEEIICFPDFPTGAVLLNKDEVYEALKNGYGKSCRVRSVIEWDKEEKCLIVQQLPYSVYTNTICRELAGIIQEDKCPDIKDFVDYTKEDVDLRIYLKNNTPERVLQFLYKNTSLQSYFSINMTVLDNGIAPVVMGQRQLFSSYLKHQKEVYTKSFNYDLKKIKTRLHILNGLLICMASIEEVIKTIKSSSSTAAASIALQKNFLLDEVQAKAVLDMKLSRLAHLEVEKLESEKKELDVEVSRIQAILDDENLLKKEIEKGLREVADKFGDARRTQILNLQTSDDDVIEEKIISANITNFNNLYIYESSTLLPQHRAGVGNKIKMSKGEYIIDSQIVNNRNAIMLFSNQGKYYTMRLTEVPFGELVSLTSFFDLGMGEKIGKIAPVDIKDDYICFITKKGYIKKTNLSEYGRSGMRGVQALKLIEGDSVISILTLKDEPLCIMTKNGSFIMIDTKEVAPIGRVARGVIGIALKEDDEVVSAAIVPQNADTVISIGEDGLCSKTKLSEFSIQHRGGKGIKIQNTLSKMVDFAFLTSNEKFITINTSSSAIKIEVNSIPLTGRTAMGVTAVKLKDGAKVLKIFPEKI